MIYHAVIIPGGGLDEQGKPAAWVVPRLDAALEHARESLLMPLSAGTTHKPPILDDEGYPIYESVAAARYLIERGCSPKQILLDSWSLDTIGNAFFARSVHCDPRRLARLLVITSNFHMPRTKAIFDWIFSVPPCPVPYDLTYLAVPDVGLEPATLSARVEKEQARLGALEAKVQGLTTLSAVHQFMFTEHAAYYSSASPAPAPNPGSWLGSY